MNAPCKRKDNDMINTVTVSEHGITTQYSVYTFGSGSPHITFTAGIHGNEVSGIYVAERLIDFFTENEPACGTVKIIPRINPNATRCMQRRSPFDGVDLNRVFPGDKGKSISYKLAVAIYEETADADVLIDLHCCGQHGLPYILSVYSESERVRDLVNSITMPVAVHSEGLGGQLFTESCRKRNQAACIIEIPSGTAGGAINEEYSQMCYNGLIDALKSMGVVSGCIEGTAPRFYGKLIDAYAGEAGLWRPIVGKGTNVKKGDVVGYINGHDVCADEDGMIMSILPLSYIFDDDLFVYTYIREERQ